MTAPAPTALSSSSPSSGTRPRHWVLPFASSLSEPCRHALTMLGKSDKSKGKGRPPPQGASQGGHPGPELPQLPHLRRLLSRLVIEATQEGDEYALSMPHEKVLATEMGWPTQDGLMPWAPWWAVRDGVPLDAGRHWGLLSPGHWLMGRDHLTLLDPQTQALSEAESQALLAAVRPLFEEDGWTLHWGAATRWYAAHDCLAGLPTASLERVIGRNPDVWLTDHPQARMVRRLQSEVQMLLYQHPLNDEREARGQSTVNSFWLSGCGTPPAVLTWPETTRLVDDLRAPLLADDMPLWLQAWDHVDGTVLREICEALDRGEPVRLTLCGERRAVTYAPGRSGGTGGIGARLRQAVRRLAGADGGPDPVSVLEAL